MSSNAARRSRSGRSLREDRGVNTLLSGSAVSDPEARLDFAIGPDARPGAILVVSTRLTPEEVVDAVRDRGRIPDDLAVVSTHGESLGGGYSGGDGVQTTVLDSPGDLTGIGIAVTETLREWSDRALDGPVVVCFDSLNSLLGYAATNRVLQFVHHLGYLLRRNGAAGYYWFDPSGFDSQTVATVEELFDAIEELE